MENTKTPFDYIKDVNNTIDIPEILSNLRYAGSSIIREAIKDDKSIDDKDCAFEQLTSIIESMYYIGAINNIIKVFK